MRWSYLVPFFASCGLVATEPIVLLGDGWSFSAGADVVHATHPESEAISRFNAGGSAIGGTDETLEGWSGTIGAQRAWPVIAGGRLSLQAVYQRLEGDDEALANEQIGFIAVDGSGYGSWSNGPGTERARSETRVESYEISGAVGTELGRAGPVRFSGDLGLALLRWSAENDHETTISTQPEWYVRDELRTDFVMLTIGFDAEMTIAGPVRAAVGVAGHGGMRWAEFEANQFINNLYFDTHAYDDGPGARLIVDAAIAWDGGPWLAGVGAAYERLTGVPVAVYSTTLAALSAPAQLGQGDVELLSIGIFAAASF